jgi:hypothetical protein
VADRKKDVVFVFPSSRVGDGIDRKVVRERPRRERRVRPRVLRGDVRVRVRVRGLLREKKSFFFRKKKLVVVVARRERGCRRGAGGGL